MQNQPATSNTNIEFDYKNPPHENESWDQFLVRSMREERQRKEKYDNG